VAYDSGTTYALGYRAVQDHVPNSSGVYTIYTARQWIYVGQSDDIRQGLFRHLNEPSACMEGRKALSFSFETLPAAERASRYDVLVRELRPACSP
jgi:excinuclease UvrABC nuclease subunit